jgi:pimeloyl-ACP methyl ester carboxylesterase
MTSIDGPMGVALASTGVGKVVAPYGQYAYYPSGMEVGGICWYRVLPGFTGTDPISLATAVVQVCDLLDDLDLDRSVLIGWGQGAVVALGAGLLQPGRVGSVVSVDAPAGHVALLPSRALSANLPPPMLLAATDPWDDATLRELQTQLGRRRLTPTTWCCLVNGSPEDQDKAVAERIGMWLEESSRTGEQR